jgi:hypothetical protein
MATLLSLLRVIFAARKKRSGALAYDVLAEPIGWYSAARR